MANLLDDLFQWAASQPAQNTTSVRFAMATNELTRNNLVSYAEGTLFYHPPSFVGLFRLPADFRSQANGVTQYFSDRRFAPGGSGFPTAPFDPNNTDPLDVTITAPGPLPSNYTITLHSSKWNFQYTVNPTFDPSTEIIIATTGPTLLTVSLCNRQSSSQQ
jgi:hypothetical protein